MLQAKKICILGVNGVGLESSYDRAFREAGAEVLFLSRSKYYKHKFAKNKIGKILSNYLPSDQTYHEGSKKVALEVIEFKPDMTLVFAGFPLLAGALGFIKSVLSTPVINIWPDTLANIKKELLDAAPLYDGIASHGKATLPILRTMGFANTLWLPFAGDIDLHGRKKEPEEYLYDITFVGGWRPSREKVMAALINAFPKKKIGIFGPFWEKSSDKKIEKYIVNTKGVIGDAYANLFNQSRINVNVIDPISYPSINMRFFEIPTAFGLQIVNESPEHSDYIRDSEHIVYFKDEKELVEKTKFYLENPAAASKIRAAANTLIINSENYSSRAKKLFEFSKKIKING